MTRCCSILSLAAALIGCACQELEDPGQTDLETTTISAPVGGYTAYGGWASGNYDRNADTFENAAAIGGGGGSGLSGNYDRNAPNFEANGGSFADGGFNRVDGNYDRNDAAFQGDQGAVDKAVGVYTRANAIYLVTDPTPGRVTACGVDPLGNPIWCDIDGSQVVPVLALGFTNNTQRADGSYRARRPAFLRGDIQPPRWEIVGPGESFVMPLLVRNGWGRAFPVQALIEFQGFFTKTWPDGSGLTTEWPLYYVRYRWVDQVANGNAVPCQPGQCPFTERWRGAYQYMQVPIVPPDRPRAQGGTWGADAGWQLTTMPFATEGGHQPGLVAKTLVGTDMPPGEPVTSTAVGGCAIDSTNIHAPFALAYGNAWETTTWTGVPGEKAVSAVFFMTVTGFAVAAMAVPPDASGNFVLVGGRPLPRLVRNPMYENDATLSNLGSFAATGAATLSGVSVEHGANLARENAFAAKDPSSGLRQAIANRFQGALAAIGGARATYQGALQAAASTSCSAQNRAQDAIVAFSPQAQVLAGNGASSTVLPGCNPASNFEHCDPIMFYERHQYNCGDRICDYFVGENLCPTLCAQDCTKQCVPYPGDPPPPPEDPDDPASGPVVTDDMIGDALDGAGANGPNDDDDFTLDPDAFDVTFGDD